MHRQLHRSFRHVGCNLVAYVSQRKGFESRTSSPIPFLEHYSSTGKVFRNSPWKEYLFRISQLGIKPVENKRIPSALQKNRDPSEEINKKGYYIKKTKQKGVSYQEEKKIFPQRQNQKDAFPTSRAYQKEIRSSKAGFPHMFSPYNAPSAGNSSSPTPIPRFFPCPNSDGMLPGQISDRIMVPMPSLATVI